MLLGDAGVSIEAKWLLKHAKGGLLHGSKAYKRQEAGQARHTLRSCQLAEIGRPLMTALYLDLAGKVVSGQPSLERAIPALP